MSLTELIKHVISECEIHSVDLRLINDTVVTSEGAPCGGLFSHVDRTLTVAVADSDWVRFLAHEFGHMQQAVDGLFGMSLDPTHVDKEGEDPYITLDEWLSKTREVKPQMLKKHVQYILECELDADRRAVDLLSEYACYPAERYIQEANTVLYAYAYSLHKRVWALPPITKIQKVVPKRFCQSAVDYLELPSAIDRAYARYKK